jgi:hypothetical protein
MGGSSGWVKATPEDGAAGVLELRRRGLDNGRIWTQQREVEQWLYPVEATSARIGGGWQRSPLEDNSVGVELSKVTTAMRGDVWA